MNEDVRSKKIKRVIEILTEETKGKVDVLPSSHLQKDLQLDSIGAIRLIARLEAEYNIVFEFSESPPTTVEELITLIESLLLE